jgi:biotin carboxyl carrier protein
MNMNEKLGSLNINNIFYQTRISEKFKRRINFHPADPRLILSFIPGTILEILVKPGQKVKKGDLLLILEAMKMQNRLRCPMDGTIKAIVARQGDRVSKGVLLMELE